MTEFLAAGAGHRRGRNGVGALGDGDEVEVMGGEAVAAGTKVVDFVGFNTAIPGIDDQGREGWRFGRGPLAASG
jgi:hypothetical protein